MTSLTVKTGGFLNLGIGLPAVISLIRNVKDQPEPVSTINRNRVKHQPKAKSQTSAEGIHDSRAGEGTRTPNHLFTRSRRNVQGCASTPGVWHNGPRKALEVPLRCCQGCCQPGHDHLQPLAASCLVRRVLSSFTVGLGENEGCARNRWACGRVIGSCWSRGRGRRRSERVGRSGPGSYCSQLMGCPTLRSPNGLGCRVPR